MSPLRRGTAEWDNLGDRHGYAEDTNPSLLESGTQSKLFAIEALLNQTIGEFSDAGIDPNLLTSLYRLQLAFQDLNRSIFPKTGFERCENSNPNDVVIARACAAMDLLVQSGKDIQHTAQFMARQLLAAGFEIPSDGGDSRAWCRLLERHRRIRHGSGPTRDREEYDRFKDEISAIPADKRIEHVIAARLWERGNVDQNFTAKSTSTPDSL